MDGLLTVSEFAARQRVTRAAVHQWIRDIGLRPHLISGRIMLLTPEDQRALLHRPKKKMGRPKKVLDVA